MILQGRSIGRGALEGTALVLDARAAIAAAANVGPSRPGAREIERLRAALARACLQLERVEQQLFEHGRRVDAEIFAVHRAMLRDPTLVERVEHAALEQARSAEAAIAEVVMQMYGEFESAEWPMLRDKAPDILDIGYRWLGCLGDGAEWDDERSEPTVLVASTLTPSDLVRYAHRGPCAALTQFCGERSHVAILARSLGVPLVSGLDGIVHKIRSGARVLVDGDSGTVVADATLDEEGAVIEIRQAIARAEIRTPAAGQPTTLDGVPVELWLNVSGRDDAEWIPRLQAVGVGLYRTEFFYMQRTHWPDEQAIVDALDKVSAAAGDVPLQIRLADFGSDKCPDYADFPMGRNPSLGARGVRLLLQRDDIFAPQVRALARLAATRPVVVLVPMLDGLDTLHRLKEKIAEHLGCRATSLPFEIAAMIEVPAAAMTIEDILPEVSGVSIGLNDLTQYVMAADREDESVGQYHDALHPAVLRLVGEVVEAANRAGKPVKVCGELAGEGKLTAALLTLGVRAFSVSQPDYGAALERIRGLSISLLDEHRSALLAAPTQEEVRRVLAACEV